jgi:lipoprotein-anchoring transpeptidase ErfK/SrfK
MTDDGRRMTDDRRWTVAHDLVSHISNLRLQWRPMRLNRRALLKLTSLALSRALLPPLPSLDRYTDGLPDMPATRRTLIGFARAINYGVAVRKEPDLQAKMVSTLMPDTVLPMYAEMETESGSWHNKLWYEVEGGYVHSALIHPVRWQLNTPVSDAGENGFWAEVTVPFTDARSGPSLGAPRAKYRYYGGTVYKVVKAVKSSDATSKDLWYQIEDEAFAGPYFAQARHLRPISQEEFSPLSPDVDPADKKLVVNLKEQRVHAFEKDREVFTSRAATGAVFKDMGDEGNFATPPGTYFVYRKTPTQHMYGGAAGDSDYFDLPGIPWVSYFVNTGIAFHGTYWHNDYGVPRSHGCVNVPSPNSKWIWRWSMPPNDLIERYSQTKTPSGGTTVVVI